MQEAQNPCRVLAQGVISRAYIPSGFWEICRVAKPISFSRLAVDWYTGACVRTMRLVASLVRPEEALTWSLT